MNENGIIIAGFLLALVLIFGVLALLADYCEKRPKSWFAKSVRWACRYLNI